MRFLLFLSLYIFSHSSWADYYGAYSFHNLGSGRVLGLAGAYTALSEDTNAFFYNPAGTGFAEWKYNLDGGTNKLSNNELEINSFGYGEAIVASFYFLGFHYKQDWFAVGIGYVEPYSFTIINEGMKSEKTLSVQDSVLNLAVCPMKEFCVGANGKYSQARQQDKLNGISTQQTVATTTRQIGLSYRTKKFGIGYSSSPERLWSFDSSQNSFFRSVVVPAKTNYGIFFRSEKLKSLFSFDVEFIDSVDQGVAFESGYYSNYLSIQKKQQNVFKAGLEVIVIDTTKTNVTWRLGTYEEPSRFTGYPHRSHLTMGFDVRFGPAMLQIAIDQAKNFNNASQVFTLLYDKI